MALHCRDLFPNGVILNEAAVAPPPCKDYHQIFITTEQIIFRWWKISLRCDAKVAPPGEVILSHEEFLSDDRTQRTLWMDHKCSLWPIKATEWFNTQFAHCVRLCPTGHISHAFGDNMVDYVIRIAEGHIDYLARMNHSILFHIIRYLDLEGIARLSQVSRLFHEICESNELWEKIYHQHSETQVTRELETLAHAIGWKKLFFTNKLQVQVQLQRTRQKCGHDWTPMVNSTSDWSDDAELNSDFDIK